ncbi:putative serine/threonine-protein kinase nek2 [Cucumis melo var. makuwa]|uniref:Putative serine/threonine-protein kinase nek2 n=1 Tax=Cucumis melo var. makuwa TaxID=1194695 RepID=A0A5D3DQ61_CUCMM|nr:putative serine/threonine-protein kinase nek2 [Cucumis melo var. makuwa]
MFDVTCVRSEGERKLVEYNEDCVPIKENGAKLNSFIGSWGDVHYHIPIIYATWINVPTELKEKIYTIVEVAFIIDSRSRKSILKTAVTTFRQFKHWLTKKYILPFKNELELLKRPPYMYSYIDQKQWKEFVRSRLCPHFEKNIPSEESELDRASMWKKARVDKNGQYDNEDVQEVVNHIISKTCADKESSPNDVLTQALGTRESSGRVRGVGGFVTSTTYFHTAKRSKKRNEEIEKLSEEDEKLRLRVQELENIHISTQSTPTSAHGSCTRPRLGYDIQCKKILEKEVVKEEVRNEKEILCESNIKMPLPLKTILRFAKKPLLAINAYDETIYYLDSLRTTSRVDIRYVIDMAITIFRS